MKYTTRTNSRIEDEVFGLGVNIHTLYEANDYKGDSKVVRIVLETRKGSLELPVGCIRNLITLLGEVAPLDDNKATP